MGRMGRWLGGVILVALAFAAIGCGGTSGSSDGSGTGTSSTVSEERSYPSITGAAREFLIPGGDNIVQTFGEEATDAERESASKVVHLWMKARVAEDWETDCKYLALEYIQDLVWDALGISNEKVTNCPGALKLFGDSASGESGNTLTGPIDSLRIRATTTGNTEKEAYAQWHGPKGVDWVLPMRKELGTWRVFTASPLERTK